MPLQFVAQGPTALPVAGYAGPADVAGMGTPFVFWGLRAVSAAYATSLGRLIEVLDVTEAFAIDILAKSDGTLDETQLNTFITGHTGPFTVRTIYDQGPSGFHLSNVSAGVRPVPVQTGLGAKTVLAFNSTTTRLFATLALSQTQPFTTIGTMNRTSGSAESILFGFESTNVIQVEFAASAATGSMYAGSTATFTVTDNAWNAVQCMFNAASSQAYVNGSLTSSLNPGTRSFGTTAIANIGDNNFTTGFNNCRMTEFGIWSGDKSSSFANVNSNIRGYWGF